MPQLLHTKDSLTAVIECTSLGIMASDIAKKLAIAIDYGCEKVDIPRLADEIKDLSDTYFNERNELFIGFNYVNARKRAASVRDKYYEVKACFSKYRGPLKSRHA